MDHPNPYPSGKNYDVLQRLLNGTTLDIGNAFYLLNVGALPARISELRKLLGKRHPAEYEPQAGRGKFTTS